MKESIARHKTKAILVKLFGDISNHGILLSMKEDSFLQKEVLISVSTIIATGILVGGFIGYAGYAFFEQNIYKSEITQFEDEILVLKEEGAQKDQTLKKTEEIIQDLEEYLEEYRDDNEDLEDDLKKAERRYEEIEESVGDALGTVEILNKKSQVDPQLLQKYSKVFFLNEHYSPATLEEVPDEYTFGKEVLINGKIEAFVEDLFEDAEDDGIDLRTVSGFRSFDRQATLKNQYLVTYGSGANQFSADQGYSEHQLGTALDFSTEDLGNNFEAFGSTEAFEWMEDNAYKYGFTLSYPEGNDFYVYEPWHWRFVGKDLAKHLDRKNLHFYDLEQREIDEYTADFFDR